MNQDVAVNDTVDTQSKNTDKVRKKVTKVFLLKMVLIAICIQLFFSLFAQKFMIGWETQEHKCLPFTMYLIDKGNHEIGRGDYVMIKSDERMEPFFKRGTKIAKLAKAVEGDRVEIRHGLVKINGKESGTLESYTLEKLNMSADMFNRTLVVGPGELWVQGTLPRTFDSRYWGTVKPEQVAGKAYPIF